MAQYADTMQIDEVHEERISAIEACLEKIISKDDGPSRIGPRKILTPQDRVEVYRQESPFDHHVSLLRLYMFSMARCPTHAMVLEMPLVPFKWSIELGCEDIIGFEAIAYGNLILPTVKRLHMVKVWLPFVRMMKPLVDSTTINDDDSPPFKMDGELWQSLESAFVSMPLCVIIEIKPEILTDWLRNQIH
ncbi:hypothetical protein IFM89_032622 [Coptis chinensis]|uniref:Uncharacterized protein n=1 Tax=Coptis chinensis TaxID=261450 RepID=A0A835IFE8_9MAGN|nr:hypothetical protein IFM89_032622 [Coptis chinensis]